MIAAAGGKTRGTVAGMTAILLWSTTAAIVVSAPGVDPFLYIGIGHLIGFGLFLLKWLWQRHNPWPELRRVPLWYLVAGLAGIAIHELTWVAALQQAPPMEATLIIYLWPLLVVVFTTLALRRKLSWAHGVGCACGLAGLIVMFMGRGLDFARFSLQSGHWLAMLCALSWALYSALSARQKQFGTNILGAIFFISGCLNLLYWHGVLNAPPAPVHSLLVVVVSAVPLYGAYMLWDYAMKYGDSQLVGMTSFLTPVLSALCLVTIGTVGLTPQLVGALTLVMLGIGCAKYGQHDVTPTTDNP